MKKFFTIISLLFASIFFYSCDEPINIFSESDDVQLGSEVAAEIKSNPGEYPVYVNPQVKDYINQRIFNHILSSPKIERKSIYPYQIELLDKPDELNAFALPGGFIYIYSGLLNYLDSEAALAGVLGHEIAHAERRHATQRMTAYYGISLLLGIVLGENPTEIEEITANLLTGLAFLANSRSDENDSDEHSFEYLKDTRYYPGGVKFFFEKLRDEGLINSNSSSIETFLSTHPDPLDRIDNINSMLEEERIEVRDYNSSGEGIFRNEYQQNIKNRLGKLLRLKDNL